MVWRLLRKNISISQIIGYALANLVGLTLVLCAIRFYNDASHAIKSDDGIGNEYLIVSRSVSMLSTLGMSQSGANITPEDIAKIQEQPWAESVGAFTSADFGISASVNFGGRSMWTYLFLESVPDAFLDIMPQNWTFSPNEPGAEVPIMLSREYLALYNFGFAASRGLPQLNEALITQIPLQLYVNGNGESANFTARIVGFSNRLNTIAVPEDFMQWANSKFGDGNPDPSRLIIKVNDPGNPQIKQFLDKHGYEAAGEGLEGGKVHYLLKILSSIVIGVGLVICALSLFILMLNITLLMQKNKGKNHGLLMLGYSPWQVETSYFKLVGILNAGILALAIIAMLIVSGVWQRMLAQGGIPSSSAWIPIIAGVVLMSAITLINFASIVRSVGRSWYN